MLYLSKNPRIFIETRNLHPNFVKKIFNFHKKITKTILYTKKSINIAIIGKYVDLKDAYKSLDEALTHGGIDNNLKVETVLLTVKPGKNG